MSFQFFCEIKCDIFEKKSINNHFKQPCLLQSTYNSMIINETNLRRTALFFINLHLHFCFLHLHLLGRGASIRPCPHPSWGVWATLIWWATVFSTPSELGVKFGFAGWTWCASFLCHDVGNVRSFFGFLEQVLIIYEEKNKNESKRVRIMLSLLIT